MANILIGCRLPNGILLHHPDPQKRATLKPIKIAGLRDSKIIGAPYVTTTVDADFWEGWKKAYPDYAPLKNGSLFEASSANEAAAKGKELAAAKTGFEPVKKDAPGIKPAEKE